MSTVCREIRSTAVPLLREDKRPQMDCLPKVVSRITVFERLKTYLGARSSSLIRLFDPPPLYWNRWAQVDPAICLASINEQGQMRIIVDAEVKPIDSVIQEWVISTLIASIKVLQVILDESESTDVRKFFWIEILPK